MERMAEAHKTAPRVRHASTKSYYPFVAVAVESGWATALQYRIVPCPWPLSSRDYFIVQDYVLQDQGDEKDGTWFFTINHNVEHPYFAPRKGFVRLHVKNQGLVGEPTRPSNGIKRWKSCSPIYKWA